MSDDWNHGFNSGCLAAFRFIQTAIKRTGLLKRSSPHWIPEQIALRLRAENVVRVDGRQVSHCVSVRRESFIISASEGARGLPPTLPPQAIGNRL